MTHLSSIVILALVDATKVLLLAGILVLYRLKRRFREDRRGGLNVWGFLDHNVVECVLGVAIVPSLMNLAKLIGG